jgi:predicted nucleic acid-binding protein
MPTFEFPESVLFDTNILLRASASGGPLRQTTIDALATLDDHGVILHICPQNMQEYRQVATRPVTANGFGWLSADVETDISGFERRFHLIPETPAIYPAWRRIVAATGAEGRANFDARLVAVANVTGISAVLTFESAAFARYAAECPGLIIINPKNL